MALLRILATLWILLSAHGLTMAQTTDRYPSKPIRIVVPWATGGFNDTLARLLSEKLGAELGQQVIVENRPGAAGTLGSEMVARAAPDGYTLLLATADTHAIGAAVYPKLRYDPVHDFAPISLLVSQPVAIWVSAKSQIMSLNDLIAYARTKPGAVTYASNGNGSATHMGMEMFSRAAGIQMLHVPYKGTGPALIDMLGGRLDTMFLSVQAAGSHGESGKLRPLAVSSNTRSSGLPTVPTFAEAGHPFRLALWQGLVAPKGTPSAIVNRLAQIAGKAMAEPDIKARMNALGVQVLGSTPEEFRLFLAEEIHYWREAADTLNIKID